MKTMIEYIADYAADDKYRDRMALVDTNVELTYAMLWKRIRGYAQNLTDKGVKKGDYVLIRCTQDAAFLTAMFAVQCAGAIPVPLEKDAGSVRIKEISEDTKAVLYLDNREAEVALEQFRMPGPEDDNVSVSESIVFPGELL